MHKLLYRTIESYGVNTEMNEKPLKGNILNYKGRERQKEKMGKVKKKKLCKKIHFAKILQTERERIGNLIKTRKF